MEGSTARLARPSTYERFYGLAESPFSASTEPRFVYHSAACDRVIQELTDAFCEGEGVMLLTGAAGVGKTTVCRALVDQLGRRAVTAFLEEPAASLAGLLNDVLVAFGVTLRSDAAEARPTASAAEIVTAVREFAASLATLQASPLIIVDDAHTLPVDVVEQLATLLHDEQGQRVRVLLSGRPELLASMRDLERPGTSSAIRCSLEPLTADETASYVRHRLAIAGPQARLEIEEAAFGVLHSRTRGIPRLINLVCDRALARGAEAGAAVIDRAAILGATGDLDLAPAGLGAGWIQWLTARVGGKLR